MLAGALMLVPRVRRLIFPEKEIEKEKPIDNGTVTWTVNGNGGAYCFKCTRWTNRKGESPVGPLCECAAYEKSHFHFECTACGFKTIMRAADDP